jgi:hypothetical protein
MIGEARRRDATLPLCPGDMQAVLTAADTSQRAFSVEKLMHAVPIAAEDFRRSI